MGLFIVGAVVGGLFGFLLAVDLESAKKPASRVEYVAGGATAMGLLVGAIGKLYGL